MSRPPKRASGDGTAPVHQQRKMTFEEALGRLEAIVEQLDDGDLPLAASLELFKEGTKLAGICREMLSQAELTVKGALAQEGPRFEDEEPADDAAADL
jgi:exodeoxyribonuclease VII small subunit